MADKRKIDFKVAKSDAASISKLRMEDAPLSATDDRNDEASGEIIEAVEKAAGTNLQFKKSDAVKSKLTP